MRSSTRGQRAALCLAVLTAGCQLPPAAHPAPAIPSAITHAVPHDSDDPAVWLDPHDPAQSLILGTDKHRDGGLYVFDLTGQCLAERTVRGLQRPNNVDVVQGVPFAGGTIDLAVVTERLAHRLRVFRLPDLQPVDGGGLPVFVAEQAQDCMGIALYLRPRDRALFTIVSRAPQAAPRTGYLHQYRLRDRGDGQFTADLVRRFGTWSGAGQIEALAVDAELGFVYAADEGHGIRKYAADPDAPDADRELACFGRSGFVGDREGISIRRTGPGTGHLLASDQARNAFRVFPREGTATNPHEHPELGWIPVAAQHSDGSEFVSQTLPGFPGGLFVAMSDDRTFHLYDGAALFARMVPSR